MTGKSRKPPMVAVVGAGYWGKNLVRNFANLGALAMVCDLQPVALSTAAQTGGVPTCVNFSEVVGNPGIEAVAIATPAVSHYIMAK